MYIDKMYEKKDIEGLKKELEKSVNIIYNYNELLKNVLNIQEIDKIKKGIDEEIYYIKRTKKLLFKLLKEQGK